MGLLHKTLEEEKIDVWSTAPQFGRMFLPLGNLDGMVPVGPGAPGKGVLAKVLSRYIGGCAARRFYCSIQPNGQVTPCLSMPSEILGDLRVSPLSEIWNQANHTLSGNPYWRRSHPSCAGCRATGNSSTEDVDTDNVGCIFNMPLLSKMQEWLAPIPRKLD